MNSHYYTLAIRTSGQWGAEFGDYDRETVEQELQDTVEHPSREYTKRDCKIIRTTPEQSAINAAIAKLNGAQS